MRSIGLCGKAIRVVGRPALNRLEAGGGCPGGVRHGRADRRRLGQVVLAADGVSRASRERVVTSILRAQRFDLA